MQVKKGKAMKLSPFKFFLFLLTFAEISQANMQLMRPQVTSSPFFEGWYTKIDTESRSIILIVGTKFKKQKNSNKTLGMVSLISREGVSPAKQYNIFTDKVSIGSDKDSYLWKTDDNSISFSQDCIKINHPKLPMLEAQMSQHKAWKLGSPFGPEGLMVHNPLLYSHWFVFSMDSQAKVKLKQGDQEIHEFGYAHLEKNWGDGFPDAWMWSQGRDKDNKTSFAFAGGRVPSRIGVPIDVWALSIKNEGREYIFSPVVSKLNAKLKTDCKTYFQFESANHTNRVSLRLQSDPKDFLPIFGVRVGDWEQVAKESFHSQAQIEIHKGRRLIFTKKIPFAAMEFGGACNPR